MQFELECRPFYVAGFNAHDLVPKSLADPTAHKTEGGLPAFLLLLTRAMQRHVKPCTRSPQQVMGFGWALQGTGGHRPRAGDVCERHELEHERRAHLRAHHRPGARLHGTRRLASCLSSLPTVHWGMLQLQCSHFACRPMLP